MATAKERYARQQYTQVALPKETADLVRAEVARLQKETGYTMPFRQVLVGLVKKALAAK
jgi:hypothetical protein